MGLPLKVLSVHQLQFLDLHVLNEALRFCDFLEARIDTFQSQDFLILKELSFKKPWILKSDCAENIQKSRRLNPQIIDLDFEKHLHLLHAIKNEHQVILSLHFKGDLKQTEKMLASLLQYDADFYKIVVEPDNQIECLKIVYFFRSIEQKNLIRFCLGEEYQYTRYFSLMDKHPFVYLGIKESLTAKGQIVWDDLVYYQTLNRHSKLLGLIGNPVIKSISDKVYNRYFLEQKIDAIYLKIPLLKEECIEGIYWLRKIGFKGLSVTSPLKELVHQISENHHGIYNTICFGESIHLYNTDIFAIIDLIERHTSIEGIDILIIGLGGLGKSLALALFEKKGNLFVANRTHQKIEDLKQQIPIQPFDFQKDKFHVIIQASAQAFLEGTAPNLNLEADLFIECVMRPIFTPFVKYAVFKSSHFYTGFDLFFLQGLKQLEIYFPRLDHSSFLLDNYNKNIKFVLSRG